VRGHGHWTEQSGSLGEKRYAFLTWSAPRGKEGSHVYFVKEEDCYIFFSKKKKERIRPAIEPGFLERRGDYQVPAKRKQIFFIVLGHKGKKESETLLCPVREKKSGGGCT